MTGVLIEHPDEWIGIPENWEGTPWANGYEWASALVDVLVEEFPAPVDDERATLRDVLVSVADSRDPAVTSRVYTSVDGWDGPLYVVNMAQISFADLPGVTAEQLAGAEDTDVVEKPLVTRFTTTSGLTGVKCIRYSQDASVDGLIARADYVVSATDSFVRFSTAQYDLVAFQRMEARMERLAQSVALVG
ncbi:MAG: hypothetical protein JWN80_1310 [Microbacteriaceae bacterium]|jgi:hypothetical protein|nr:hypothetical protein [Microbacteriaceae bacterium]